MKQLCYLLLLIAFITGGGCKKETNSQDAPGNSGAGSQVYSTANSKLPGNQVNAIAIDKSDVKWIGTANGLARINGSDWIIFNEGNSPLPSSFIRALVVQEDGTVWVGTNKGLAKYNGTNWQTYTTANSLITHNGVMCITYDAKRKITWVGTEKELISIDSNDSWKRFDTIEDDLILSMATGQDGALWLGTFYHFAFRGRIRKFNNNEWTTFQLDQIGFPSTFPYSVAVDKNNSIYAVLSGTSVKSVIRLSAGTWQEIHAPDCATGLKTVLADNDKIWVGGNTLAQFGNTQAACLSIPGAGSNIQAMALDSKGRLWLGTVDGGVAVYQK